MKSKYLRILPILTVVLLAGYTAYNSNLHQEKDLSGVNLTNLEALADPEINGGDPGESGGSKHYCYDRYSSADWFHKDDIFIWCHSCVPKKGHNLEDRNSCINRY